MFLFQTYVFFGHNTLCRSESYFDQPDEFIPERWLPGVNTVDNRRLMSLCALSFGHGARNCVGRRVAEQQMYLAIIKVSRRVCRGTDVFSHHQGKQEGT